MWLARLFGGRKSKAAKRPARIAPRISDSSPPAKRSPSVGNAELSLVADADYGFDPYNSGSFERNNAWERVIRR